jgi:hypothetical protein
MRFGSPLKREKPSRSYMTDWAGLWFVAVKDSACFVLLHCEAHLLSTDGFWMDFPPRRLDSGVRVLQGQRRAYIDSGVDLLSGKQWDPATYSAADKGIDHDGQTLAYNSLILHPK